MVFKKKQYKINHFQKNDCKICRYRDDCNKTYLDCNKLSGFESPCFSCIHQLICRTYLIIRNKGEYVYECHKWEKE